jgi:quinoprotein glucose dehydrogenase
LPALAATLNEKRFSSEALLRRGINACLRVGGENEMDILILFAKRNDLPTSIRAEALATLGVWASPSVLDRVDGRLRGKIERDPAPVKTKVRTLASSFLQSDDADILVATAQMLTALDINDYNDALVKIMQQHNSPDVRSAMLTALHKLKYDKIETVIKRGMEDKDGTVRTAAVGLLNELDITKENLPGIVEPIFKKGSIKEQQELLKVLGEIPIEKSEPVLERLLDQLASKKLSPAITLDLIEAVDSTHSEKLSAKLTPLRSTGKSTDSFLETLYGGDARQARRYFMTNSTGQCVRCHAIRGEGGNVGPDLTQIGDNLTREELLRALIEPSARLSPGYGSVKLTLKDGQVISGILTEETQGELILKTADAEPIKVSVSRINKRENMLSSMPPMGTLMSKREIRDMIEFLSNLKK